MLGIAPFFHCFGLKAGVLSAVLGGATLVPQAVFDVHRHGRPDRSGAADGAGGPAAGVAIGLLNDAGIDRSTLRSLRVAMVGAARFSHEEN